MKKLKFAFQAFTVTVDVLGLILSLLSMDAFDNTILKQVVHLCQAFRSELILLLVLIFMVFNFLPFAYRHLKETDHYNRVICLSAVVVTVMIFFPYALRYAKARYYYFNNNIMESYAQFSAIEKGVRYLKLGEYDLAQEEFNLVEKFSASSRYKHIVSRFTNEINSNIESSEYIYKNFVEGNPNLEDKLHKLRVCADLHPSLYKFAYTQKVEEVRVAIDKYTDLYLAVQRDDYSASRELIQKYGDVWFEPIVKEKLLHDNATYVLKLLHEYLDNEDCISAQKRLNKKLFK